MSKPEQLGLIWTPFLKQRRGRVFQAVGVTLPRGARDGGELSLWVGARKYSARVEELLACPGELGLGHAAGEVYLFLVPRPRRATRCRAEWKAGATPAPLARVSGFVLEPAEAVRVHLVDAVWSPAPSGTHTELLGLEEMCRLMYAGRGAGAARLSGVPAHTASMGMALAGAGCRFLEIEIEPGVRQAEMPELFWWKLPDGKRLLVLCREKGAGLLPGANWAWGEWAAERGAAAGQMAWLRRHFDSPTWREGRHEDFGDALARRHGKELPVIDKEFTDWTVLDAAGAARGAGQARRERERLVSEEALSTLAAWSGGRTKSGGFPLANGRGSVPAIVLFNTLSWARGGVVRVEAEPLPAGEFELVDASTGGAVIYERDAAGIEFVAPLVPACGYLRLEMRPVGQRSRCGAQADWSERQLTLHTNEYTLQFHTAGGMCRWHDRRNSMQWCSGTAEYPTGGYLYELPSDGRREAFRKQTRPPSTRIAQMMRGEPAARVGAELCGARSRMVVEGETGAGHVGGTASGNARGYRVTYTLFAGRPELYVNLRLFGKRGTSAAEAGYAFFPFAVEEPYVLLDRGAHLTTPADDLAAGVNAASLAVQHGVRVEGYHAGMNFYPLDTPLIAFGSPGAWLYDRRGAFENATIYATLFSNCGSGGDMGGRQAGDFSFDFVLHPTGNDGWDGGLAKGGMEYHRPLLARVVRGVDEAAPAASWLTIRPAAVQLVALKPSETGRGFVLRLWNSLLDPVQARVVLPAVRRGDELWRCDLIERTGERLALSKSGEARLKLGPHEVVTLLLR